MNPDRLQREGWALIRAYAKGASRCNLVDLDNLREAAEEGVALAASLVEVLADGAFTEQDAIAAAKDHVDGYIANVMGDWS